MSDIDAIDLDLAISKSQYALFEYHFSQADAHDYGIVSSIEANNYFQRTHLKADQLKIIWNLADPHGKGYLDRRGFFVALKLIALAQNNLDFHDYSNINKDIVPPNITGDIPQAISLSVADVWTIGPTARCAFDRAFDKLSGTMNKLPGTSVKPIFLKSGLSADQLHKIWELSDIDEDGALDRNEFAIAMFLIHGLKSSTIRELPERLPINLLPIRMRRVSGGVETAAAPPGLFPGSIPVSAATAPAAPSQISPSKRTDDHWIVSAEEKLKFDPLFQQLDQDKDGFINGKFRNDLRPMGSNALLLIQVRTFFKRFSPVVSRTSCCRIFGIYATLAKRANSTRNNSHWLSTLLVWNYKVSSTISHF